MLLDPTIAIVGISNWALDSSKMNRAVCLQRPEPSEADIMLTGHRVFTNTGISTSIGRVGGSGMMHLLQPRSDSSSSSSGSAQSSTQESSLQNLSPLLPTDITRSADSMTTKTTTLSLVVDFTETNYKQGKRIAHILSLVSPNSTPTTEAVPIQQVWLANLAKAFHYVYSHQRTVLKSSRDFIGMRDFYGLLYLLRNVEGEHDRVGEEVADIGIKMSGM